ncbi:uncharacterized protein LOC112639753 [Camponotus floridanus]|uniref:uncharacterized protein LOC112639753 n=1 Tax=Camponotus floridanus TaxID=104421 RepID=UPI000DC6ADD0|nr:uncharacterized protein LOC112639753 [Camponotus floridanus]
MSPTTPILSALLLSLISGSTEGGLKMDPVALLRQTLRYWRKIYKTYHEEVTLGYCWADYLLKISDELSTNLSVPPLVATGDRDTTIGATKSQRNPFPQNAMADTAMPFRETQKGKHLREKRSHTTARSVISRFTNDSDKHRIVSTVKMFQEMWMMNIILSIISNNKESTIDENKRIASMIYIQKKRQAFSMPELFHDQPEVPRGHEFSSREICSDTVNPTPNPKDDDKVGFKLTNLEEDTHREVLYLHSTNHSDSFIKDTFVLRNLFLLAASRERSPGNHRSPFRQYPQSRERNSEVDELLSDPRTPEEDRGMKRDPEENHIPLNDYGSSLSSRLQLRRINAVTVRCTDIVKLTNSVANPSCNPARAINSEVLRRKPEELSRDSLLLPREEVVAAERSPLESRGSGRAVKKNAFSRFNKITGGSDAKKRRYQQPRVEKKSRIERDVSAGMIRPFLPRLQRLRQQMLYKNRLFFPIPTVEMRARQGDDRIRAAPSLSRVGRFIENYENSTSESVKDSRLIVLQARQLSLRSLIITVFRTLGIFVQVGRQVIDVVESNAILACTKEYLMTKIIRWIDA